VPRVAANCQAQWCGRSGGFSRGRGRAGSGDYLVLDPAQFGCGGVGEVEGEFFVQFAGKGSKEVLAGFDVAAGGVCSGCRMAGRGG
jgi:hypothetical protein